MKSLKNHLALATLATLPILFSVSASGADLTAWRTAAIGEVKGNGNTLDTDQVLIGTSSSATLCKAAPATPCQVAVSLKSDTPIGTATPVSVIKGELYVLGADPVFHLPTKKLATYDLSGDLNLNLATGSGTVTGGVINFRDGSKALFNANLSMNLQIFFNLNGTPAEDAATRNRPALRVDLTLQ